MGNPMDGNIHAPTVPSGPTTGGTTFRDRSKSSMVELMNEKEIIEAELSTLSSVLSSVSQINEYWYLALDFDRFNFHSSIM
jgi:26S proteasome regulatory subunit N4